MEELMNDTLNIPNQKYELTDKTMTFGNDVYYQIRALRDFGEVHKGDLGGWVQSPLCLSQRGKCWLDSSSFIEKNARVSGNAKIVRSSIEDSGHVSGDAVLYDSYVRDQAKVTDKASIFNSNITNHACVMENTIVRRISIVSDNAIIKGNALIESSYIEGNAVVKDKAVVTDSILRDNARVYGSTHVIDSTLRDRAKVYGKARIDGECELSDKAEIYGSAKVTHVFMHHNSKICGSALVKAEGKYDSALELFDETQIKGLSVISILHDRTIKDKPLHIRGNLVFSDIEVYNVKDLHLAIDKAMKESEKLSIINSTQEKNRTKSSLRMKKNATVLKDLKDLANEL